MFKFIKNLFKSKSNYRVSEKSDTIGIGDTFAIKNLDDNPFHTTGFVTVKDVKQGWVLYAMHPMSRNGLFQNESMKIKTFLSIYRKVK